MIPSIAHRRLPSDGAEDLSPLLIVRCLGLMVTFPARDNIRREAEVTVEWFFPIEPGDGDTKEIGRLTLPHDA